VLQCAESVLQSVIVCCIVLRLDLSELMDVSQCVERVLQGIAVCCSALQYVAF